MSTETQLDPNRKYDKWGNSANEVGKDLEVIEGCCAIYYCDNFCWQSGFPWKEGNAYPQATSELAQWIKNQNLDFISFIRGEAFDYDEGELNKWEYLTTNKPIKSPEWKNLIDEFTETPQFMNAKSSYEPEFRHDRWGNSANKDGKDLELVEGCFVLDYNDAFFHKSSIPWKEEIDVYPTAICDFGEWLEDQDLDFISFISGSRWEEDEECYVEWRYLTTNKPLEDPEWKDLVDGFVATEQFKRAKKHHQTGEFDYDEDED